MKYMFTRGITPVFYWQDGEGSDDGFDDDDNLSDWNLSMYLRFCKDIDNPCLLLSFVNSLNRILLSFQGSVPLLPWMCWPTCSVRRSCPHCCLSWRRHCSMPTGRSRSPESWFWVPSPRAAWMEWSLTCRSWPLTWLAVSVTRRPWCAPLPAGPSVATHTGSWVSLMKCTSNHSWQRFVAITCIVTMILSQI